MKSRRPSFATIDEALDDLRDGGMVVVVRGEEGDGYLTVPAQFATPEAVNFMVRHARGLLCLALTRRRCDELGLELMGPQTGDGLREAFTVTIDARYGITTGISASDRSHTIEVALHAADPATALVGGGHVSPLRAEAGGVLARRGYAEAAVDLASLAGLESAGVVCGIMRADGNMARLPDLRSFCAAHGLNMVSMADLVEYRATASQRHLERAAGACA